MLALCKQLLSKGYKHYFYGGGEGVHERLAKNLPQRFPGLRVVGGYSPPFRSLTSEEDEQVAQAINAADPYDVWIGLSTPKQERWGGACGAAHRAGADRCRCRL
jgi:N-acetylglucosaminyldiphosphoundecaprenol N-acetyl-beta-D-mannosaminyltransferase